MTIELTRRDLMKGAACSSRGISNDLQAIKGDHGVIVGFALARTLVLA